MYMLGGFLCFMTKYNSSVAFEKKSSQTSRPLTTPGPLSDLIWREWASFSALLDELLEEHTCLQYEGEENLIKQLVSISPDQIILQTIGL